MYRKNQKYKARKRARVVKALVAKWAPMWLNNVAAHAMHAAWEAKIPELSRFRVRGQ